MIDGADRPGLQTHTVRAFAELRADILSGRLMPGAPLRTEPLRERYRVSVSSLREALMRLEAEGFVRLEQNKGFKVSAVSAEHLRDLTRARIEIESIALRWSIANGHIEWEAELLKAFHRLSRQPKIDPSDQSRMNESWTHAHRIFHASLVAACGSPIMLSVREALFDQVERYVALSITFAAGRRDDVGEHEAIMRAALDHNANEALSLNREHIERTASKLAAIFSDNRVSTLSGAN